MITSKQNKTYKLYLSLKLKKYRDQHGLFLVYGPHLIEEAKKHHAIKELITSNPDKEGTLYDSALWDEFQQTETSFDQIGICKKMELKRTSTRILVLDDVQDPDNVGALIRSAAAFGFLHVIFSPQCADLYNEKTIRASKGSIFDVYVERKPLKDALIELKNQGYKLYFADAHDEGTIAPSDKMVLILGNEGHGIHQELKPLCDQAVHIQTGRVESLNVSVAGAIIMHEWRII